MGYAEYRRKGVREVQGWLEPQALDAIAALDAQQRAAGVTGSIAEIGVHHGKLFIGLALLRSAGERALAIDLFDQQDLNVDSSGMGDRQRFEQNVRQWGAGEPVVYSGDSTALTGADVVDLLQGQRARLFSVDGGHTEEIVSGDLTVAAESLAGGGVVIADDVFNASWPGVVSGVFAYLRDGGGLVPFGIGFNKVFFADPGHASSYSEVLAGAFEADLGVRCKTGRFFGHDVAILRTVRPTLRDRARRYPAARTLYRRVRALRS